MEGVLDFIASCLNIVPGYCPPVYQLKQHKLVAGDFKNENFGNEINIRGKM